MGLVFKVAVDLERKGEKSGSKSKAALKCSMPGLGDKHTVVYLLLLFTST